MALRQYGVIRHDQASRAGLSAGAIHRLTTSGQWRRIHPGVYVLWGESTPHGRRDQCLMAAALWLGDGSAVSHRASGLRWELDGIERAPIELSTTKARRPTQPGVLVHRVRALDPVDVTRLAGLPITTVPRTIVDLAGVVSPRTLELALESALRRGLTTLGRIAVALSRAGARFRGRRALGALLDEHPRIPTESELETLVDRLIVGSPSRPIRQYEIRDETGRFVARTDIAFPEAKLAIEADGYRFHSSRTSWQRDRTRQNELMRLGWTVYRVTWEDVVKRPQTVRRDVMRLVTSRRASAPRTDG